MKIKKGDKLPDAKVFVLEKDPKEVSIKEIVGDEKVILFGLPGAFTPTCSTKHLPGFVTTIDLLREKNIEKIICISIIGSNRSGIFLHLMPIFGAVMAMIIFDEKFMFYHLLGAVFILMGIVLSNRTKSIS